LASGYTIKVSFNPVTEVVVIQNNLLATAVAKASVQRQSFDAHMAKRLQTLGSFAHELDLIQDGYEFGLATQKVVVESEDRLLSSPIGFARDQKRISGSITGSQETNLTFTRGSATSPDRM
jgi:hypothetical protein